MVPARGVSPKARARPGFFLRPTQRVIASLTPFAALMPLMRKTPPDQLRRVASKCTPPQLHSGIVDTRLQRSLGAPGRFPVLWLSASAGTGKTQGVRKWLEAQKVLFAWYQLDALDEDVVRSLFFLRASLKALVPPKVLPPEYDPKVQASVFRYLERMLDQVSQALREPAVLVLDDEHLLEKVADHELFDYVLRRNDPRLSVLVLSRREPPPEYARLIVNRVMQVVDSAVFCLNFEESKALLSTRGVEVESLEPGVLRDIMQLTRGWATALRVLRVEERAGPATRFPAGDRSPESGRADMPGGMKLPFELFEMIRSEIVAGLEAQVQVGLRILSLASSFDECMVQIVEPSGATLGVIRRMVGQSALLVQLEGESGSHSEFRFHPLLREFLISSFHSTLSDCNAPAEFESRRIDELLQAYVQSDCHADALEIARQVALRNGKHTGGDAPVVIENWSRYISLLGEYGLHLFQRGEYTLLLSYLEHLPPQVEGKAQPERIRLLRGAARLPRDPASARLIFDEVLSNRQSTGHIDAEFALAMCLAVESIISQAVDVAEFSRYIELFEEFFDHPSVQALPTDLLLRWSTSGLTAVVLWRNQLPLREGLADQIYRLCQISSDAELVAVSLALSVRLLAIPGNLSQARPFFEQLQALSGQVESVQARLMQYLAEVCWYLIDGDYERSVARGLEGIAFAQQNTAVAWRVEIAAACCYAAIALGDRAASETLLGDLESHDRPQNDAQAAYAEMFRGLYWSVFLDDDERALYDLHQALERSGRYRYAQIEQTARCAIAVIEARRGNIEQARHHCQLALDKSEDCFTATSWWASLTARAYVDYYARDYLSCLKYIRAFLAAMQRESAIANASDWWEGYILMLNIALEQNIEREFVHRIIRRRQLYPKVRPGPKWPYKYELGVLGQFVLSCDGLGIEEGLVRPGARYELFTALVWLGGREILDEVLIQTIWPASGNKGKNMLYQALKRLRQSLGSKDAIIYENRRISLNPRLWRFDAWEMILQLENLESWARSFVQRGRPIPEAYAEELRRVEYIIQKGFVGATKVPLTLAQPYQVESGEERGPLPLLHALARAQVMLT